MHVYDKLGRVWVQRGPPIQGPKNSDFGSFVRIASGTVDIRSNPLVSGPFFIGVQAPGEGDGGVVYVYECKSQDSTCTHQSARFEGYQAFDISDDGSTVALGEATGIDLRPKVEIYSLPTPSSPVLQQTVGFESCFSDLPVSYNGTEESATVFLIAGVSLSTNGARMAVTCATLTYSADLESSFNTTTSVFETQSNATTILGQGSDDTYFSSLGVSISGDGSTVAFVSPSGGCQAPSMHSFVQYDRDWIPRSPIPLTADRSCRQPGESFGVSFSMSDDGGTVAVGHDGRDCRVYDFDGPEWNQAGNPFRLSPFTTDAVSMSVALAPALGNAVVLGVPSALSGNGGAAGKFGDLVCYSFKRSHTLI